jgi:hypothetical protein
MIRFLKVSIFGAIALAIGSCALQNEKSDYRLGDNVAKGLIVFSLSVEGSKRAYIAFRQVGHVEHDVVYVNARGVEGLTTNYDWKEPFGRLIYLELDAGEYEFYGWHPKYVCGWDMECFSLSEKISFSVNSDTVSYIGNIHFDILSENEAYKYEISDEFDRDISLLTSRLVNVKRDQVNRMIASAKK